MILMAWFFFSQGYTNNSMSVFNTSDFTDQSRPNEPDPFGVGNETTCRLQDLLFFQTFLKAVPTSHYVEPIPHFKEL